MWKGQWSCNTSSNLLCSLGESVFSAQVSAAFFHRSIGILSAVVRSVLVDSCSVGLVDDIRPDVIR